MRAAPRRTPERSDLSKTRKQRWLNGRVGVLADTSEQKQRGPEMVDEAGDDGYGVLYSIGWGHDVLYALSDDARTSLEELRAGLRFRIGSETTISACEGRHLHVTVDAKLPIGAMQALQIACYIVALATARAGWQHPADFGRHLHDAHVSVVEVLRDEGEPALAGEIDAAAPAIVAAIMLALHHRKPLVIAIGAMGVREAATDPTLN